jgi:capsular polysaccharide biosynthesis protein
LDNSEDYYKTKRYFYPSFIGGALNNIMENHMKKDDNTSTFNEPIYQDEINIYDLWLVLKKRKLLVFAFTIICSAIACTYTFLSPNIYIVTNMITISPLPINTAFFSSGTDSKEISIVSNPDIIAIINSLNELTKQQLAIELGLDIAIVKKIKDREIKAKLIRETSLIDVKVKSSDKYSAKSLIDKLPSYLQTRTFIKSRIENQKGLLEKNRNLLKNILDDPAKTLNLNSKSIIIRDLTGLANLWVNYNAIDATIKFIEEGKIIMLTETTSVPEKPTSPKSGLIIILGSLSGMFIGVLLAFIIEAVTFARIKATDQA